MKAVEGNLISDLPYKNLEEVQILVFNDRPILTHYKDENNKDILFLLVDHNGNIDRWLVWSVSENSLNKYLNKTISLKYLLEKNQIENPLWESSYPFLVDIDNNVNFNKIIDVNFDLLPDEYKPGEIYL